MAYAFLRPLIVIGKSDPTVGQGKAQTTLGTPGTGPIEKSERSHIIA